MINKSNGFTLVELIVVFSVMATLSAVGIVGLSNYNRQTALQRSIVDLVDTLNAARSRALSQVKPSECGVNPLEYYKVDLVNKKTYQLEAICGGSTHLIYEKKIYGPIEFSSSDEGHFIEYPVLKGSISEFRSSPLTQFSPTRIVLTDSSGTPLETIDINSFGIITFP